MPHETYGSGRTAASGTEGIEYMYISESAIKRVGGVAQSNDATEYVSKSTIKQMSGGEKRQCDRALAPDHMHQHADRQPEALVGRVELRGPRVRRGLAAGESSIKC